MISRRSFPATLMLTCLLLVAAWQPAAAATFSVSPIRVELDAQHRSAILTFNNSGETPLRMQVRPMLWSMQADGQWKLTPSDDLIVTPELLEVAPGKNVQLRVGSLLEAGATEASYRLLINELPNISDKASAARPEIKVLTQVSLPIFVEPANPVPIPVLRSATLQKSLLELGLGNSGNQRLDAQNVTVNLLDAKGQVIEQHQQIANYVLAGATWFLRLNLPASACARAASVSVSWSRMANLSPTHPITKGAQACEGTSSPL